MSTRSFIAAYGEDDKLTAIYCHFDGYPQGVGRTLLDHYTDPDKVRALLALGSLSVLGAEIGERQDFNDRTTHREGWCLAYGRDRGETGQEASTHDSLTDLMTYAVNNGAEYLYVMETAFRGGNWWRVYDIAGQDLDTVLNVGVGV